MSHLTQSMVEEFFAREEENARGVLRKEMDSAMDTIFKQMKQKLIQLVESGHEGNETADGMVDLGDPLHHEQQLHSSSNQIASTSTNSLAPDNANSNEDDQIPVKNKLAESLNIITNEPIPPSSTQCQPSNEQSNDKIDNLFDELDDEDCDCSDCMNEYDDISHSAEDLDESNHSGCRPTKRPRIENDQVQDQPNNQTNANHFITISLKCFQCSEMFQYKDALNAHLKAVHSIQKYRCLYKDCNRSFSKQMDLTGHNTAHSKQSNTTWPCGYCSGHYKDSKGLYSHYLIQHEEGLFQCAHLDCQFVGELKQTVINHFYANHKQFVCHHPGCTKQYSNASKLKVHERTHLNATPYRCKLPNCDFAGSAYKQSAILHIRKHLAEIVKKKRRTNISQNPNDHLEVVNELL